MLESEHITLDLTPGENSFGHLFTVDGFIAIDYRRTPTGPGRIAGRVTDSHGEPVYRAKVMLHASDPYWAVATYTDRQGRYDHRVLPEGEYCVAVLAPFHRPGITGESPSGYPRARTRAETGRDDVDFRLDGS
jgi:hypothetical protein